MCARLAPAGTARSIRSSSSGGMFSAFVVYACATKCVRDAVYVGTKATVTTATDSATTNGTCYNDRPPKHYSQSKLTQTLLPCVQTVRQEDRKAKQQHRQVEGVAGDGVHSSSSAANVSAPVLADKVNYVYWMRACGRRALAW